MRLVHDQNGFAYVSSIAFSHILLCFAYVSSIAFSHILLFFFFFLKEVAPLNKLSIFVTLETFQLLRKLRHRGGRNSGERLDQRRALGLLSYHLHLYALRAGASRTLSVV